MLELQKKLNQREERLLNNRLHILSNQIAKENRKPKASRNFEAINKAKQRMSTIKYWINSKKELKRLEPIFRAQQLQMISEAHKHRNPFDQMA